MRKEGENDGIGFILHFCRMAEAFVVPEPSHRLNLICKQFQKPRAERLYALCSALMGEDHSNNKALPAHHELAHLRSSVPGARLCAGGWRLPATARKMDVTPALTWG